MRFRESRRKTKDGRIVDVWITATALFDERKQPAAIAKIERDITEQKHVRAKLEHVVEQCTIALRKSQEQLTVILQTAADAIITIDQNGIIQSVKTAAERIFGCPLPSVRPQSKIIRRRLLKRGRTCTPHRRRNFRADCACGLCSMRRQTTIPSSG